MPRSLTDAQRDHLAGGVVGQVLLLRADLHPDPLYLTSLAGGVRWQGDDYEGGEKLIRIELIGTNSDLSAPSFTLRFSYTSHQQFNPVTLTRDTFLGKEIAIWYAPFDTQFEGSIDRSAATDPRFIGDPIHIVRGVLDEDALTDSPTDGSLDFRVVNHLDILNRRAGVIYSHEHQKQLHGDDDQSLANIAKIQDYRYKWGPNDIRF